MPTKWIATPQPAAQLFPEPGLPVKDDADRVWHFFRTTFGVRFARVVEPNGLVIWRKEINTP
jgi:hypothetical protein